MELWLNGRDFPIDKEMKRAVSVHWKLELLRADHGGETRKQDAFECVDSLE